MSITSSRWSFVLAGLLVALFSVHASAQQELTFTPFHANGLYQPGEKLGWTVTRSGGAAGPTRFAYDITKNELEVLRSVTLDLSSGTATIEARFGRTLYGLRGSLLGGPRGGRHLRLEAHREGHTPV